jgi:hypothetical protein
MSPRLKDAATMIALVTGVTALLGSPSCASLLLFSDRLNRIEIKVNQMYCYLLPDAPECPK